MDAWVGPHSGVFSFAVFVLLAAILICSRESIAHSLTVTLSDAGQQKGTSVERGVLNISDNVDLVLLDVLVRRPHGGYVTGLTKGNFKIFEDGSPREITQFANIDTPVTVGLVVDNSGSMRSKRPEVVLAGLAFAKQSNPQDQFFVVNFNNYVTRGLPFNIAFTDNIQLLRHALDYGEPVGQTALYDAVAYALKHLELSHFEKRTLIVVSDGGDNVSVTRFPELMTLIEASRATIYTIGLLDPNDRDLNPSVLKKMAAISGGEFFEPEEQSQIVPVFDRISKEIRNRYTIGYIPNEATDKRVSRTVKVRAEDKGVKLAVRTRTSYSIAPLADRISALETATQGGKN
ncbi:MAG: VWA domain-containing protein [Acidobacteriaceae bacterium]|nr:VWA domain-containing protein [Acidobacteriaceae bacterium]MBV9499945.1 VWA domain-containing protein [Acidobacteriaceae bacterium]